ncbi:MAG: imelysin family protein [Myxococcota bacterium]|nr:imelysin family protein [Myxococcota bacterium]
MIVIGLSLGFGSGCIEPVEKPLSQAAQSESSSSLLEEVGPSVVLPALNSFHSNIEVFRDGLNDITSVIENNGNIEESLEASRNNWLLVYKSWQELEVMQIGSAGSSLSTVGGEDKRDEIYSWPTVSGCLIDQMTVTDDWKTDSYFDNNLVNAYGLDAIEHLLFSELETECPSQVPPISDGSWYALEQEENGILKQRIEFAKALSEHVEQTTEYLIQQWSPDGENFSAQLTVEGASPFADKDEALYAVFLSLFYVELLTKDRKLAQPLGLRDCPNETCVEDIESLQSGLSLHAIQSNLVGFKNLFTGGTSTGMDDLLIELGHADLSEQIILDVDAVITLLDAHVGKPLDGMITDDKETVIEIYDHIGLVTTALKQDLTTVLEVSVPSEAAGDND